MTGLSVVHLRLRLHVWAVGMAFQRRALGRTEKPSPVSAGLGKNQPMLREEYTVILRGFR